MIAQRLRGIRKALRPLAQDPVDPNSATQAKLRRIIGHCPSCQNPLDGHSWAAFAEAGNESDFKRLLELCRAQDWQQLIAIHSFNALTNDVIAIAIKCGQDHGAILTYIDYYELYSASELVECHPLTPEAWKQALQAQAAIQWQPF